MSSKKETSINLDVHVYMFNFYFLELAQIYIC
jgi:hypothetical protein